jgi:RimJ/RimL family protein N-acetyltransferase
MSANAQVLGFPPRRLPLRWEAPLLGAPTLSLRDAEPGDMPYLRQLYASSRAPELALMPWPDAAKQAFCDSQFDLQHRHYVTHFTTADFLIVLHAGVPAGRLYLHEADEELCIVDILLDEAMRGQGHGSALLRRMQQEVQEKMLRAVKLQVLITNQAARRLYERLGFVLEGDENAMHLPMRWRP